MTNKYETGRSMVEMLGVLAVIGILSVAGIAGYTSAMKKHRANEILNEASKRAVLVAAQAMTGKTGEISLGEFTQNTFSGITFADKATVANNKITLALSGSGLTDICTQLKNATGDNGVMQVSTDCSELTFNADMSRGSAADSGNNGEDEQQTGSCPAGSSTSGVGMDTGVKDGEDMCKCTDASDIYDKGNNKCHSVSNTCPSNLEQYGSGNCLCDEYNTNQCGYGWYCKFPTGNRTSGTSDNNGHPLTSSGDILRGICTQISNTEMSQKYSPPENQLSWFSAYSFCRGMGLHMPTGRDGIIQCSSFGGYASCTRPTETHHANTWLNTCTDDPTGACKNTSVNAYFETGGSNDSTPRRSWIGIICE